MPARIRSAFVLSEQMGVRVLNNHEGNVGHCAPPWARPVLDRGARWLACTDADKGPPEELAVSVI